MVDFELGLSIQPWTTFIGIEDQGTQTKVLFNQLEFTFPCQIYCRTLGFFFATSDGKLVILSRVLGFSNEAELQIIHFDVHPRIMDGPLLKLLPPDKKVTMKKIPVRPSGGPPRFFLGFRNGKCVRQPIGINTIGEFPKRVAAFLCLSYAEEYTSHCFRRSSASVLADTVNDNDIDNVNDSMACCMVCHIKTNLKTTK